MTSPTNDPPQTNKDTGASLVRTYTMLAVGAFLTWVARRLHIVLDADSSQALTWGMMGLISAGYYTIVRLLERKSKVFGWFLGLAKPPKYVDGTAPARRTL